MFGKRLGLFRVPVLWYKYTEADWGIDGFIISEMYK